MTPEDPVFAAVAADKKLHTSCRATQMYKILRKFALQNLARTTTP